MNTPPVLLFAFFSLLLSSLSLKAQLDILHEKPWLGYFVSWENRKFHAGIGADGKLVFMLKKGGKLSLSRQVKVTYLIEEEINGKWIARKFKKQNLNSESEAAQNPSDPIAFQAVVSGETKVEFTHHMSRDFLTIKTKLIEKKTTNPIRLGVILNFPSSGKKTDKKSDREMRRLFRSDKIKAVRASDGKNVKANYDEEVDFSSPDYLQNGASLIEIKSESLGGEFTAKVGNEKNGLLLLTAPEKLYAGNFKITWHPNMAQLEEADCSVSFGFK